MPYTPFLPSTTLPPPLHILRYSDSVYSIISNAVGGFVITSENGTFPPITASRNAKGYLTAFFPNLNESLTGEAYLSFRSGCVLFNWERSQHFVPPAGTRPFMQWVRGPLPPAPPPCTFSKSLWHSHHSPPGMPINQVFVFDSIDTSHFTIHSLNGTFDDTTATIGHGGATVHLVTAQFSDQKNISHGFLDGEGAECRTIQWVTDAGGYLGDWETGPLPPPPPPPPAQCETSFNQTACDAAKHTATDSCVWCASNDGDHNLCFHKSNEPDSGTWKCDGAAGDSYLSSLAASTSTSPLEKACTLPAATIFHDNQLGNVRFVERGI